MININAAYLEENNIAVSAFIVGDENGWLLDGNTKRCTANSIHEAEAQAM